MPAPGLPLTNNAPITPKIILQAYRSLYRTALQAIHFSTPARHQLRSIIRGSFRNEPPSNFVPRRIENTVRFLERAREFNGVEHSVLRNLLHVAYWRRDVGTGEGDSMGGTVDGQKRMIKKRAQGVTNLPWLKGFDDNVISVRRDMYSHFDATVDLLNESMNLCLRSAPLSKTPQPELSQPEKDEVDDYYHLGRQRGNWARNRLKTEAESLEARAMSFRNGHTKEPHRPRKRDVKVP